MTGVRNRIGLVVVLLLILIPAAGLVLIAGLVLGLIMIPAMVLIPALILVFIAVFILALRLASTSLPATLVFGLS